VIAVMRFAKAHAERVHACLPYLIAAIATVTPLFFSRHLPFSDMPEHLSAIATIRRFLDDSGNARHYFDVQGAFETTYLLYHGASALLSYVTRDVESANLLLITGAGLAMVPSLYALLRSMRAEPRLALIAGPLFWNRALAEGLMSYVFSIPVLLASSALALENLRAPTRKKALGVAALAIILFYLHSSSFLLFVLFAAVASVVQGIRVRGTTPTTLLMRHSWLVASVLLVPVFLRMERNAAGSASEHAGVVRFLPKGVLLANLWGWSHDFWTSSWDDAVALAMWGCVVAMLFARRAGRSSRDRALGGALFLLCLGSYFLMPNQVSLAFILALRIAPLVAISIAALVGPRKGLRARVATWGLVGVNILFGVLGAHAMHAYETDEARYFDHVMRRLPPGKRLVSLVFAPQSRHVQISPYVHFGSYYQVRYGGLAGFSFSELSHWPVHYKPEFAPPKKPVTFWDWNPCFYRNTIDGRYYDFVLVRGERGPFDIAQPGPNWRVIGMAREWVLYEKVPGAERDREGPDEGPCRRPTT
jgi:hypothetical protein